MAKDKAFTEPLSCGHCRNKAPFEIVAHYSSVENHIDEASGVTWEAGDVYQLILCPACQGISLRKCYWHDGMMDPSEVEYETLYPTAKAAPRGMPLAVAKAYEAAARVRQVDPNAYGVLLGRVIEMVCADKGAKGNTLDARLKVLADQNDIPQKLVGIATGLRRLRNIGAHASLGELTPAELPVLDDLTRALLEYVYSAPMLAQEAEERLNRLRGKSSSSGADQEGNA